VTDDADPDTRQGEATSGLVGHYFRHEYGRLVAQLANKVGVRHVELVEDAVQSALAAALTAWVANGLPRDPSAWLYRVASNQLVGELRKGAGRLRILATTHGLDDSEQSPTATYYVGEVRDDLLRMLFVCCDDAIPRESRIVLALKTLCGFSTAEIALRLFTTEVNVHKRLQRARETLRDATTDLISPPLEELQARLPSVHEVLYLLFNEGYLSVHAEFAIRRDLCEEAIRLATLLAEHPRGAVPETFALLALMNLHGARLAGRIDGAGGLLLLVDQDRGLWDQQQMRVGMEWLARSASGAQFSRYHAEAGIAAEHCLAPSFHETRWQEIADLYALLEQVSPSPLHTLNRAVAVAEWQGVDAALRLLDGMAPPAWLERSYLWDAVLADLYRRAGRIDEFERHRSLAASAAPSEAVRDLLERRLSS
jgi:RNA polymerase sigma factor (sigma-70 family)